LRARSTAAIRLKTLPESAQKVTKLALHPGNAGSKALDGTDEHVSAINMFGISCTAGAIGSCIFHAD
jgi:hypothetical protein